MVYQAHLTKFCVLRPLTSKRAAEVAFQLADIFLLLGSPVILQSDNGSEFTAQIITELRSLWPELSIVHGKSRHPQSQGSVERANGDIKDMLVAWMADNNSTDWATGIKFVQFSKNLAYHAGIKRSPYAAMFGVNTRVGLTSTSLPQEIISCLQSEQDLITTLQHQETDANEPEVEADVNEPEREPPKLK
ncbi:KRAB-A domain-containing protein 2-like [Palaemon carinicauda]|uniref:KRAB-A domain-containing protein 2-like n=1 Tax=Palaemon carinicauda TaxID=392227 RepID=UPI0035B58385